MYCHKGTKANLNGSPTSEYLSTRLASFRMGIFCWVNSLGGVYHTQRDQNSFGDFEDPNLKLKCFAQLEVVKAYCVCFCCHFITC